MKIRSDKLTTTRVADDGSYVDIEFLDRSGTTVTVEFPLDQAEAIVTTLPHLLERAVKRQTGDESSRYVFDLHGWRIEGVKEHQCLLATLTTTNGFEACFAIPLEACRSLAWHLNHTANEAVNATFFDKSIVTPNVKLN